ncbi:MAG: hypothetical protein J6U35_03030 [Clostridia bacterium]|nr:hypothetical protein [Clostridia bacterium]
MDYEKRFEELMGLHDRLGRNYAVLERIEEVISPDTSESAKLTDENRLACITKLATAYEKAAKIMNTLTEEAKTLQVQIESRDETDGNAARRVCCIYIILLDLECETKELIATVTEYTEESEEIIKAQQKECAEAIAQIKEEKALALKRLSELD